VNAGFAGLSVGGDAKRVLHEAGLSAYEIGVYSALLAGGEMTAMEVSKKGKVPYSKIYDALNSLMEKGWIKSGEGRPSRYYPLPPLEALAATKLRLEDRFKAWESTVTRELQSVYEKRELVEHPDILILHGQESVMAKLEEILKRAGREVMIAAPEFARSMVGPAAFLLEDLGKSRVSVRLMVVGGTEGWEGLKGLLGVGEARVRDQMFGGGVIVDGREAMLFLGEEKPSLVIWSNHVGLVRFARDYFQFLWDSSKKVRASD